MKVVPSALKSVSLTVSVLLDDRQPGSNAFDRKTRKVKGEGRGGGCPVCVFSSGPRDGKSQ